MDKRIEKLAEYINEYGEDFLNDGTKDEIVNRLKSGDQKLALEILECMDSEWKKRVEETEINKFIIFSDYVKFDENGNILREAYIKANYIDSLELKLTHIPTLRMVKPRELNLSIYNKRNDEWER